MTLELRTVKVMMESHDTGLIQKIYVQLRII